MSAKPAAWTVLVLMAATSALFQVWHAIHRGHMQTALAVVVGLTPVLLALCLSHIGASWQGGKLKAAIWVTVIASMVLSAQAVAWAVAPAEGTAAGWLFGIVVDGSSIVALVVITTGSRETVKATAKKPPKPAAKPLKAIVPEPEPEPVPVASQVPDEAKRARARYLASVAAGEPLTDRRLAAEFAPRSRTWAATRIAEAQADPGLRAMP